MDLLKKNLVTVICGVVAILAVAAVFWPIKGYYAELQTKVDDRKKVYDSMDSILKRERHLPVLDIHSTEPRKFDGFPNETANKEAKALIDKVKASATTMYDKAWKLNKHELLVDGSLGDSPGRWNKFRQDYIKMMDVTKKDPGTLRTILDGGFPPTDVEITNQRAAKEAEIRAAAIKGPNGEITNQPMIDAQLLRELPKLADDMKRANAQACHVYLDLVPFDPSPTMVNNNQVLPGQPGGIDPSSIFNAQVGLWVHEDICNSIAAANKGAKDVTESAVKHLVKIDVLDEPFKTIIPGMGGGDTTAVTAPNADPAATIGHNYGLSPTGRLGVPNGVFDVLPFDVKLVVDATQVQRVMMELARSKFITITNVSMTTVDSALKHSEGYLYGESPVVQLDLRGEALLLRKWTEPLMPLRIKQALGLVPVQQAAQPAQ